MLLVVLISSLVQAALTPNHDVSTRVDVESEQCGVYSPLIQSEFVDQFKSMLGTDVSLVVIYNETYDARPIDYEGDYDHELLDHKTLTLWRHELASNMPGLSRRTIEDFYSRNVQPELLCDSFDLSVGHVLVGRDELENLSEVDRLSFHEREGASGGRELDSLGERPDPDDGQDTTQPNAFQRKYSGAEGLICLSKAGFNTRMNQALV